MKYWLTSANEYDVVRFPARCFDLCVDNNLRESITENSERENYNFADWKDGREMALKHLHCAGANKNRLAEECRHIFVHQRMRFDEIQCDIGQRSRIVVTRTRSWIWNLLWRWGESAKNSFISTHILCVKVFRAASTLSATNSMPSLAFTSRTWIRCWLQPFDLCSQHDRHVRNIECDVHWNLLVHSILTASARESTEAAFNLIARTVLVGRNNYSKYKTPYMYPSSVHSQSTAIETMPKPERADEHSKHDSFQLDFLALLPMRCRYI